MATNKGDELDLMCEELSPDVLVVTENGFNNSNIELCKLNNYQLANYFCRNTCKGGGIAIFVKNDYLFTELHISQATELDFEATGIKIQSKTLNFSIIGIYRSPSGDEENFFSKFESIIAKLTKKNKSFFLVGDFNINVLETENSKTKRFKDLLRSFGLQWSVNDPTRVTDTSSTAIDNVITNIPGVAVSVVSTAVSDHYGIEAVINGSKPEKEAQSRRKCRDTRPANIALLNSKLSKENWGFLELPYGSVEEKFLAFKNSFEFHLDTCCPVKETKVNRKKENSKWITNGILVSREKLKFYSEIFKTTKNLEFKIFFRRYKNIYRKVIKAAKAYDVTKSILSADNVSKTAWSIINKTKNLKPKKSIKLSVNKTIVNKDSDIANEFNKFFANVATNNGKNSNLFNPNINRGPVGSMALLPVTEQEVSTAIQSLSAKKSYDVNLMSVWLLKQCSPYILGPLTLLVNLSFESGYFPSNLKVAKVTPIFKKGDPCSINNYRPVSILPVLSKVFEKLFLSQMVQFLDQHNVLSKNQFGFRKGKSTIDAVVSLVDMVVEGLERRNPTLGVFLDLSKAFDCVEHGILLQNLYSLGIRGVPHAWLESFLSNRTQVVQISSQISKSENLKYGVPQGSILSPLLFLVYVNDTGSSLLHGRPVQYADDTTLCFSANSKEELEVQTYLDLNSCSQFFNNINLVTNSSKSNFINFSLRNIDSDNGPSVMMAEVMLEEVYSTKFLGIHVDRGLTWSSHIDSVCAKLSSGVYVLRQLSKYCPLQVMMTAYYGLIYPHLSYGVSLWGACASTDLIRVFKLQKRAVRVIKNLTRRESCKPVFVELQLLTLPCIYILETSLRFLSKCATIRGRDIHVYPTRGRDNYRTGQHRTVVHERLPSQAGVHLVNNLPNSIKDAPALGLLKHRLKYFLTYRPFYSVAEFLSKTWETN